MRDILLLILLIPTDQTVFVADRFETVAECVAEGEAWLEDIRPDYGQAMAACAHASAAPLRSPRPRPRAEVGQ